jgi:hypothetical protein
MFTDTKHNIWDLQNAKVCAIMSPVQSIVCFNIACPKIIILWDRSATFKSQKHISMIPVRLVLSIINTVLVKKIVL